MYLSIQKNVCILKARVIFFVIFYGGKILLDRGGAGKFPTKNELSFFLQNFSEQMKEMATRMEMV